jgi:fatty-acid peroxygenase
VRCRVGPRFWQARRARRRTEHWVAALVERVRNRELDVADEAPLATFANFRDVDGERLSARVAAVELINLLRPTVAIGRYVAFAALALHEHPEHRERAAGDPEFALRFVQEVRRYYPFFPMVAARARVSFDAFGHRFKRGERVMLDLHATNHDPALWKNPSVFEPDRFLQWSGSAFDFIPQGGGDHHRHHRCPGEWITIEQMKLAVRMLTTAMRYRVPPQDLSIDLSRIPTMPASGFVMTEVAAL